MNLGARTAAWSGEKLPYLRQVEYLQSDGNAFIDTGLYAKSETYSNVVCMPTISNTGIIGSQGNFRYGWCSYRQDLLLGEFNKSYFELAAEGYGGTKIELKIEDKCFYVDDVLKATRTGTFEESVETIALFAFSPSRYPIATHRVYSCIIDNAVGGASVDLMSVVALFNGVEEGCMYDRVSKQLFRNAGTGAFTWGELT